MQKFRSKAIDSCIELESGVNSLISRLLFVYKNLDFGLMNILDDLNLRKKCDILYRLLKSGHNVNIFNAGFKRIENKKEIIFTFKDGFSFKLSDFYNALLIILEIRNHLVHSLILEKEPLTKQQEKYLDDIRLSLKTEYKLTNKDFDALRSIDHEMSIDYKGDEAIFDKNFRLVETVLAGFESNINYKIILAWLAMERENLKVYFENYFRIS